MVSVALALNTEARISTFDVPERTKTAYPGSAQLQARDGTPGCGPSMAFVEEPSAYQ